MCRAALGLGVIAVLLAAAGCSMCCHPYDDCGPVYSGSGCQSCMSGARVGSILGGSPELSAAPTLASRPIQSQSVASAPIPRPTQRQSASFGTVGGHVEGRVEGQVRSGDVPGSEQIVSVTDRAADEPSTPSADQSPMVAESSSEPASMLPSTGWTACRPSPDVRR
jgi:hypothetical protein